MTKTGLILVVLLGSAVAGFAQNADPERAAQDPLFPLNIGGHFQLTDQNGRARTEIDPDGNLQLLFFGYASCREICSSVLPQMAEVDQSLKARSIGLTPILITIDPKRDTVATLGQSLVKYGTKFVGLTGSDADLKAAYKAFSIENSAVYEDPFYGPVYAHGSFLYLLNANGGVLTVIPPILSTDRVIDLIATYASKDKAHIAVSE